jgi:hypothetical protein
MAVATVFDFEALPEGGRPEHLVGGQHRLPALTSTARPVLPQSAGNPPRGGPGHHYQGDPWLKEKTRCGKESRHVDRDGPAQPGSEAEAEVRQAGRRGPGGDVEVQEGVREGTAQAPEGRLRPGPLAPPAPEQAFLPPAGRGAFLLIGKWDAVGNRWGQVQAGPETLDGFVPLENEIDLHPECEIALYENLARRLRKVKTKNVKRAKQVLARWLKDCPPVILVPHKEEN